MACILLVDDTETYLSLEQRVLGPAHRYLLARNGLQALSLARAESIVRFCYPGDPRNDRQDLRES